MEHSTQIDALADSLCKAQSEIGRALRDSDNPFFKSKYADLASVADACMDALTKHGLSVIQGPESNNGDHVVLHTMLCHASGQWVKSSLTMVPVKADPQGIGSCITYARRYALAAMVGVAPEDDDGNEASGLTHKKKAGAGTTALSPATPHGDSQLAPAVDHEGNDKPLSTTLEEAAARREEAAKFDTKSDPRTFSDKLEAAGFDVLRCECGDAVGDYSAKKGPYRQCVAAHDHYKKTGVALEGKHYWKWLKPVAA